MYNLILRFDGSVYWVINDRRIFRTMTFHLHLYEYLRPLTVIFLIKCVIIEKERNRLYAATLYGLWLPFYNNNDMRSCAMYIRICFKW